MALNKKAREPVGSRGGGDPKPSAQEDWGQRVYETVLHFKNGGWGRANASFVPAEQIPHRPCRDEWLY